MKDKIITYYFICDILISLFVGYMWFSITLTNFINYIKSVKIVKSEIIFRLMIDIIMSLGAMLITFFGLFSIMFIIYQLINLFRRNKNGRN